MISPTKEVGISGNLKIKIYFSNNYFCFNFKLNFDGTHLSSKRSDISRLVFIKYGHTVVETTADFNIFNSLYKLSIIPTYKKIIITY